MGKFFGIVCAALLFAFSASAVDWKERELKPFTQFEWIQLRSGVENIGSARGVIFAAALHGRRDSDKWRLGRILGDETIQLLTNPTANAMAMRVLGWSTLGSDLITATRDGKVLFCDFKNDTCDAGTSLLDIYGQPLRNAEAQYFSEKSAALVDVYRTEKTLHLSRALYSLRPFAETQREDVTFPQAADKEMWIRFIAQSESGDSYVILNEETNASWVSGHVGAPYASEPFEIFRIDAKKGMHPIPVTIPTKPGQIYRVVGANAGNVAFAIGDEKGAVTSLAVFNVFRGTLSTWEAAPGEIFANGDLLGGRNTLSLSGGFLRFFGDVQEGDKRCRQYAVELRTSVKYTISERAKSCYEGYIDQYWQHLPTVFGVSPTESLISMTRSPYLATGKSYWDSLRFSKPDGSLKSQPIAPDEVKAYFESPEGNLFWGADFQMPFRKLSFGNFGAGKPSGPFKHDAVLFTLSADTGALVDKYKLTSPTEEGFPFAYAYPGHPLRTLQISEKKALVLLVKDEGNLLYRLYSLDL